MADADAVGEGFAAAAGDVRLRPAVAAALLGADVALVNDRPRLQPARLADVRRLCEAVGRAELLAAQLHSRKADAVGAVEPGRFGLQPVQQREALLPRVG